MLRAMAHAVMLNLTQDPKLGQRQREEWSCDVRDSAVHRETTEGTKHKGQRSLAGRRIVGGYLRKAQGSRRGCSSDSCQELFGPVWLAWPSRAYPLLDVEGKSVTPLWMEARFEPKSMQILHQLVYHGGTLSLDQPLLTALNKRS